MCRISSAQRVHGVSQPPWGDQVEQSCCAMTAGAAKATRRKTRVPRERFIHSSLIDCGDDTLFRKNSTIFLRREGKYARITQRSLRCHWPQSTRLSNGYEPPKSEGVGPWVAPTPPPRASSPPASRACSQAPEIQ